MADMKKHELYFLDSLWIRLGIWAARKKTTRANLARMFISAGLDALEKQTIDERNVILGG